MKNNMKLHWILAAAAGLALANSAMAQYRVGGDGRALDANNRIGSGGVNAAPPGGGAPQGYDMLGNNIVTGNVTAGRQFRGFVPYAAPDAFRGNLPGEGLDRFVSESSAAPYSGVANNNAQVVQSFIPPSQFATPPAGFVQQPGTNAYIPQPQISQQPSDARLGTTLDIPQNILPQPGQLILPGPVDPNTQTSSVITASPLYGVRQWNSANAADQAFINNNLSGNTDANKIDPTTLQQMRSELLQPPQQNDQQKQQQQNSQSLDNSAGVPFGSPQNESLSNSVNGNGLNNPNNVQVASNLSTGAQLGQRTLMSPQQQSTQYAALQNRLQQYTIQRNTNSTSQQQRLNQTPGAQPGMIGASAAGAPASPNAPQANAANTGATNRSAPLMVPPSASPSVQQPQNPQVAQGTAPQTSENGEKPKPMQIHSLAEGVQAKGLADLLKEAEDQMKAGHYNSALEQYELAEQVAPNNPLILLGRANAELGQSYYTRSDTHLRQAFSGDHALLMGQYDLNALLGQDRLQFLVQDLKAIAKSEPKESRPLFLLAYIAYNTNNERKAAAYLDLAEKRAGGKDAVYETVRKYWSLPSDAGQNPNDVLSK